MNFLFVNYGDFTSNSLNHIGAFARQLTLLGHACVVAVPENPETISVIAAPLFRPVTFAQALGREPIFPDGRSADVLHAWTPRENVREFTLAYLQLHAGATLLIHLEDNEIFLMESFAHETFETLRQLPDEALAARLSPRLSHPIRFKNFLQLAHGATCITDRLRDHIPAGKPVHRLLPGIAPIAPLSRPTGSALRSEIGLAPHEKVIFFPGSTTFANLADIRALILAVRLINDAGTPCRLVRAGLNPPAFARELASLDAGHLIDLGFIPKSSARLEPLLALADVLVQPGAADAFNDYRLPSKIPEFLSVGRPVVIPRANLAREMEDGRHALLLETGTPAEIAEKCLRVFADDALAQRLAAGALEFAHAHFDLAANTAGLLAFYEEVRAAAVPIVPAAAPILPGATSASEATPAPILSEDVLLAEGDARLRFRAKEITIAAHLAHIARLDAEVAALNAKSAAASSEKNLLLAQASYQHAKLQSARNQIEVLRGQLADATTALAHLTRDIDATRARADTTAREVAARDDKIQRMTRSFSWQATGPLRSLRRAFLDSRKKIAASGSAAAVDATLAHAFDEPADWSALPPTGTIRGWVVSTSNSSIAGVRLRAHGKIFVATSSLARPDVAAGHPKNPHALRSGFVVDYTLPADAAPPCTLEALTDDGRWRVFAAPLARIVSEADAALRRDYATWVRRFDTPTLEQTVTRRARLESLAAAQRPLISILLPTYNTPERWLVRAIESVRAQLYPHWELCIADDASSAPHVRRILDDYARRDARLKVTYRAENGHISAASNSALALATGEFTALLDHDDELPPHALAENIFALAENPALDFLYSDEDKIDEAGRRFDPYFKPDWNPDLFLGQNYTCHFSVFRTARLRAIGGFREGYEGSQDWDLTLRFVEQLEADRVHHLPKILYHWRAIPGSTALVIDQKNDYPFVAAKKALADHLARTRTAAELISVAGRHWRVKRALPAPTPRVSIVIPTKNAESLLRLSIGSILAKTTYPDYEILIVDNRSDDPATLAYFDELRGQFPSGVENSPPPPQPKSPPERGVPDRPGCVALRILPHDAPFNFSAINNAAARAATGNILAFLNNDLEVITPDWLEEMVSHAVRPEIGCVGAMLYYPDDTIQHAGAILGLTGPAGKDGVAGHAFKCFPRGDEGQRNRLRLVQNYSAVTAACLVIRRDLFESVGGFNERDLAVAFNDIDLCLRVLKSGHRNLWTPFAEFYHHESASRGAEDTPEKVARFQSEVRYMRTHYARLLDRDPAYNVNLSLHHEDFSLSFPTRSV